VEFNTEFLQFSSLGASIYRLTVQMSVWLDKTGSRLDGQLRGRNFENFAENLSCLRPASGRSHVRCKYLPYRGFARPDQEDGRPNGWSDVRNLHIWYRRVRTMITDVRTSGSELRYLPYGWARPEGNPRRPDDCSNLPISVFWKEFLKLDWTLRIVWTGC